MLVQAQRSLHVIVGRSGQRNRCAHTAEDASVLSDSGNEFQVLDDVTKLECGKKTKWKAWLPHFARQVSNSCRHATDSSSSSRKAKASSRAFAAMVWSLRSRVVSQFKTTQDLQSLISVQSQSAQTTRWPINMVGPGSTLCLNTSQHLVPQLATGARRLSHQDHSRNYIAMASCALDAMVCACHVPEVS